MRLNAQGWLEPAFASDADSALALISLAPSPHFDARPAGSEIDCLVVHNISLPAGVYGGDQIQALFQGELDTSRDPSFTDLKGLRVSSHFLIRRDGALVQFVSTHDRAWHAGESCFQGRTRCNDFSIGIELEGCDADPFEPAQMTQLISLVRDLAEHHTSLAWIVGHSDIAPGRKTDPGPHFPWRELLDQLEGFNVSLQNPCRFPATTPAGAQKI